MGTVKDMDLFLCVGIPQDHAATVRNAAQEGSLQWRQPQVMDGLRFNKRRDVKELQIYHICSTQIQCDWGVWLIHDRSTEKWSNLVASMTKGFAGHISSQTVEDQVPAGGARGDGAVIGIEWHTGHLFFMILSEKKTDLHHVVI